MKPLFLESNCPDNDETLRAELAKWASTCFEAHADAGLDDMQVFARRDDGMRAVLIGKAPGLVALIHGDGVLLVDAAHFAHAWEAA
jgi:hypothetical protein